MTVSVWKKRRKKTLNVGSSLKFEAAKKESLEAVESLSKDTDSIIDSALEKLKIIKERQDERRRTN